MSSFPLSLNSRASISVVDASNVAKNTVTAAQSVQQVMNQATQIQNQIKQLQNQLQSLQSLPSSSFSQVNSLLSSQARELRGIFASADGIGYEVNGISQQFDQLFPQGTDWQQINQEQFGQFYQNWNNQLTQSAKTAMQVQSSVNRVQDYNTEMRAILSRSQGAEGEVRQLQAQNQMLAILSDQMGDLTANVAINGRLAAEGAAQAAAQEQAYRELNRRAWDGFGVQDLTPRRFQMP